ncbi:MAG: hypothetical protein AVDCRST_MAG93-862 [uncultured Chloroflexia bacterium]|uniref:Uncharacterized protein n=1 Tax=uncultured Chloroflexia bacterium TaxID=1672391 RepID=A0A6J4HR54_9CHLR|nr:MAG: hypothetical protein AVDCRST_MAG93-862 [uncultured Chloroflexia bacterium]
MAYIGPKLDTAPLAWLLLAPGALLGASAHGEWVAPATGWVTGLGGRFRRVSGTPTVAMSLYVPQDNGSPRDLLGRTGRVGVSISANGANAEASIAATNLDLSPSNTAIRVEAGQRLAWSMHVLGGSVEVGLVSILGDRYTRTVNSGWPTDPFDPAAQTLDVAIPAGYIIFEANRAPAKPHTPSPANGAAFNITTPSLSASFGDLDAAAPINDKMREYAIEVREAGKEELLWGGTGAVFTASDAERTAKRFTRVYNGSPLPPGDTYEWRSAVADDTRTYGEWSDWQTFTINAAGEADASVGSPAGKLDSDPALIAWSGPWTHPNGYTATQARVRVFKGSGLVRTGALVNVNVAPGLTITVPAASAGIGDLDPGAYEFEILAKDGISNLWSSSKPAKRGKFRVNAPALTPTNLQPPSGSAASQPPLIEFSGGDPDADDIPGSDVVWDVRIKTGAGVILGTYETAAYDPSTGKVSLQTTTQHFPSGFGTYLMDARGRDVSAGARGTSPWSREHVIIYQQGPTVTVLRPNYGGVLATSTPLYAVQVPGLIRTRWLVYKEDDDAPLYDSGQITNRPDEHQQRANYLRDKGRYDLVVMAWDNLNRQASSLRVPFSVAYEPPRAPENPAASSIRYPGDPWETGVLLTWSESDYPQGKFDHWAVTRRGANQPVENAVLLREIRNAGESRWVDPHPPLGHRWVYGLSQIVREGSGTVAASPVIEMEVELASHWSAVVLASIEDPAGIRAVLWTSLKSSPATLGGSSPPATPPVVTWGTNGMPTAARPAGKGPRTREFGSFTLFDDDQGSAEVKFERLEAMSGMVVSARRGKERIIGQLQPIKHTVHKWGYTVNLSVEERSHPEDGRRNSNGRIS